jgi:DNA mismatch repair ATPase MutS
MSIVPKLSNALHAIEDAERVIKRVKSSVADSDVQYQMRKTLRELDEAKRHVERARREVRDIES